MTVKEFSDKTSELIKMHPNQADLLCIATTDAFDEEDESPMLDQLMNWCLEICANNVIIEGITI
jgi:hypothetical protein